MWGPDPPTEIALRRRLSKLLQLAKQLQTSGEHFVPTISKRGGLVTSKGSPTPSKRPLSPQDDFFLPRRAPRRSVAKDICYSDPQFEDSEDEKWSYQLTDDYDSEEDEDWKPDDGMAEALDEGKIGAKAVIGETWADSDFENGRVVVKKSDFGEHVDEIEEVVKSEFEA